MQEDGRITNADLAERVGLSESPCLRRVKRMEQDGLIRGFHAHLDQDRLGAGFTVFVGIKLRRHANREVEPFEAWARQRPEITACFLMTGEIDYLLYVTVDSLSDYERFLTGQLLSNDAIDDINSSIAVRAVKQPFGIMTWPVKPL